MSYIKAGQDANGEDIHFITEKDKLNRDLIDFVTGTKVRAGQNS